MYTLTLTESHRDAFDWVGDRYAAGEVSDLLRDCLPDDVEWGDGGDITFEIPESTAWEINRLFEEEDFTLPCFDAGLVARLMDFLNDIV
jgi:hypothetical protein